MEPEVLFPAIALLVIVTVYPIYLIWRFLTLGIKAFKKYLKNDYFSNSAPQDELE